MIDSGIERHLTVHVDAEGYVLISQKRPHFLMCIRIRILNFFFCLKVP